MKKSIWIQKSVLLTKDGRVAMEGTMAVLGLSDDKLAKRSGCAKNTVRNLRTGENVVCIDIVILIQDALNACMAERQPETPSEPNRTRYEPINLVNIIDGIDTNPALAYLRRVIKNCTTATLRNFSHRRVKVHAAVGALALCCWSRLGQSKSRMLQALGTIGMCVGGCWSIALRFASPGQHGPEAWALRVVQFVGVVELMRLAEDRSVGRSRGARWLVLLWPAMLYMLPNMYYGQDVGIAIAQGFLALDQTLDTMANAYATAVHSLVLLACAFAFGPTIHALADRMNRELSVLLMRRPVFTAVLLAASIS